MRLVYADALDESGDPANATRAEFIRAQVELEAMPADDPMRAALAGRCTDLFTANWIEWWRPVCLSLGLPEPYVPSQTLGGRVKRWIASDRRAPGAPYQPYAKAWSIISHDHAFTVQFIAGFPELLAIHNVMRFMIEGPFHDEFGNWFTCAPFHRLRCTGMQTEAVWDELDGPHLAKLTELVMDRLTAEVANRLAFSPLRGLTALRIGPITPAEDVVRSVVTSPQWPGLRSLSLLGICAPEAIRVLATESRLPQLEELSFGVGEVPAPVPITGIVSGIGAMASELLRQLTTSYIIPPGPITGPHYWPVLEALAASPLYRQLRRFTIVDADPNWIARAAERFRAAEVAEVQLPPLLSDGCVRALADGLNADKLERLELPRTRLSAASWEALAARFGSRLVLA